ncbi:MAG: FeoA family protein [Carnobacterium sp.]|uniref:FeoA family protein n=1 Tax=Carnobacterium sp. TaxID=48221 RepID=UPI002FCAF384
MTSFNKINLHELLTIKDLSQLDQLTRRRLKDVGITEGSIVEIKRRYPFGGPCMIESDGQRVGIRKHTLDFIFGDLVL